MLEGGEFQQLREVRAGETGQNIAGRPNTIASRRHWAVAESMRVFTYIHHSTSVRGLGTTWNGGEGRRDMKI